jgi:hypothetical protein
MYLLSAVEFFGHTDRIILKRTGNTGREANNIRQIFLQAYFNAKQKNAFVSVC